MQTTKKHRHFEVRFALIVIPAIYMMLQAGGCTPVEETIIRYEMRVELSINEDTSEISKVYEYANIAGGDLLWDTVWQLNATLKGEAIIVEMPGEMPSLLILMTQEIPTEIAEVGGGETRYTDLFAEACGLTHLISKSTESAFNRALKSIDSPCRVKNEQYPAILQFTDKNEPHTLQEFHRSKFKKEYNTDIDIKNITLNKTTQRINPTLNVELPWFVDSNIRDMYLESSECARNGGVHCLLYQAFSRGIDYEQ